MNLPKNVKDIAGKKFGMMTAIRYLECTKPYGALWIFRCECGKILKKHAGRVITGGQNSCGCIRRTTQLIQAIRICYSTHRKAARMRDIKSSLTKEDWAEIASKPCFYCGDVSIRENERFGKIALNSVDRVNNERFYRKENSVPACIKCNMMKNSTKAAEFIEHARKIARFNGGF